jgi:hypothetical protein
LRTPVLSVAIQPELPVVLPTTLWPNEVTVPATFGDAPVFLATMLFRISRLPVETT